ncbi:MAG TPA: hypothetical protein DD377_01820 [Firmicutes bacterium]|nr:hypothetical protein [Bacillota bacterium]
MDNVMPSDKERSFVDILKSIAPYIAIAFIILSYLGFAGDFIRIKVDGNKTYYTLASILSDFSFSCNFLVWIGVLLPAAAIALIAFFPKKKEMIFASMAIMIVSTVFTFIIKDLYASKFKNAESSFALWGVWMPSFMAISTFILLLSTCESEAYTVTDICECGMLIAMAFVLNFIKLFSMPTGGSINLQMVPLFILALRRGPIKGFVACGLVYGLLTCLTDGYGLATFPFDYLIGFGSTCVLGFVSKVVFDSKRKFYDYVGVLLIVAGGVVATFLRLLGSTISSMVLYDYTFADGIVYNAAYIPLQGLFALIVTVALYGPLQKLNKIYPVR